MYRLTMILAVLGFIAFAMPAIQSTAEESNTADVAAPADEDVDDAASSEGGDGSDEIPAAPADEDAQPE